MSHLVRSRRRATALAAGILVAGLLPALAVAAPAGAEPGCTIEQNGSPLPFPAPETPVCDDTTPPDTVITKTAPEPNRADYLKSNDVTFTFNAVASDGDPGPWSYKCRLDGASDGTWTDCGAAGTTTPQSITYKDLGDLKSGYTFRVYAIDTPDAANAWTDGSLVGAQTEDPAMPDDDSASPASTGFKVDTANPATFIFGEPDTFDPIRPEFPMVQSRNIQVRLTSSESRAGEGATYDCTLNDVKVACQEGFTRLTNLTPGNKTFTATATDLAGNQDASPAKIIFAVPRNLQAPEGSGWRRVKESGYFAADYLEARRVGATIVTKPVQVRELRLIAPAGPNLGRIDLQIGNGQRKTISLFAKTFTRFKVYVIRDEFSPLASGKITLRVKSLGPNKVARIDALLIQPVGGR